MKRSTISVLLIEDNDDDAFLIQEMLVAVPASTARFDVTHVERLSEGLQHLKCDSFDVILADLSLPDSHGMETFICIQQQASAVPIIVLTGLNDDTVAVDALQEGAQDFLVKGQVDPNLLVRAIRYAIERKQAETSVAKSAADLEKFAYMVSQEMQEPLQAIVQQLSKLEQRLDERVGIISKALIGNATTATQRVQTLSDALLTYMRMTSWGTIFEPTESQTVLQDALEDLEPIIRENGATITHDALPTVIADELQLFQLFQHLLRNAIAYRSEVSPEIHVGVTRQNEEWIFAVSDNGIGIDAQYVEQIFDPFYRLDKGANPDRVGIGLAICKKVIERHGGRIWVESALEKGSAFYFSLPINPM